MNYPLAWALIHFLWQGTTIAVMLWALLSIARHASARLRYGLACAALLAMPVAVLATYWLSAPLQTPLFLPAPADLGDGQIVTGPGLALAQRSSGLRAVLPWVTPLWIAGVLAFYLRSLGSWILGRRLLRTGVCAVSGEWHARLARLCEGLRLSRAVVLLESCLVDVPVVMGFLRPVILMPLGMLAGLSTSQVESILLHELAHIRRWDYVVNLLQSVVEGLLFYHPAVWWVSKQIRAERENCCDDVVVLLKGDAREYAAALATLERNRWPAREPALAATGGSLMKRIRRLLQEPDGHRGSAAPVFVIGLLLLSLAVALAEKPGKPAPVPAPAPAPRPVQVAQAPVPLPVPIAAPTPLPVPAPRPVQVAQAQSSPDAQQGQWHRLEFPVKLQPVPQSPYRKWLNEDVAYIITDEERSAYKRLLADEEREQFIQQFWLRRDPTPATVENEFREEYYRRIAYANERFASGIPGWKTDRGRIYIQYGPPDEIESHPSRDDASAAPFERWQYRFIEGIGSNVIVEFVDPARTGEYRMTSDPSVREVVRVKTGTTVQLMSTLTQSGGRAVLISVPVAGYGQHAVNVLGTVTSTAGRPVTTFEQSLPGSSQTLTRFLSLPAGSYRLKLTLKDMTSGALAGDEMDFEVK